LRLFVAVEVPDAVKDAIERDVVDPLRDALVGARWSRPEGRHLTLKFLGNVGDERVEDVARALAPAVATVDAFDAAFDAVGGFPNLHRPRVLWVGIGPGREELVCLASVVEEALAPLGFATEERAFHPHLTLARFKQPRVAEEIPSVVVPADRFEVGEVVLFRSQLHPKGARYTAIQRFPLRHG
jgi:2'-5' RNA ligase